MPLTIVKIIIIIIIIITVRLISIKFGAMTHNVSVKCTAVKKITISKIQDDGQPPT